MTVLSRPWRAFLSLFSGRRGASRDEKWVEPWNAITLAVLYGDPGRLEQYALDVVCRSVAAKVNDVHLEPAAVSQVFTPAAPQPAHDYFAESESLATAASETTPEGSAPNVHESAEPTEPRSAERAA